MCSLFTSADPALWEVQTRSVRLHGMSTSVRLEAFFWGVLEEIAARDGLALTQLLVRLQEELASGERAIENFASFLRVCCGRYLALRAEGVIGADGPRAGISAPPLAATGALRRLAAHPAAWRKVSMP